MQFKTVLVEKSFRLDIIFNDIINGVFTYFGTAMLLEHLQNQVTQSETKMIRIIPLPNQTHLQMKI